MFKLKKIFYFPKRKIKKYFNLIKKEIMNPKTNQLNTQKKNQTYSNINYTLYQDNQIKESLRGEPYVFRNFLPLPVHLFVSKKAQVFTALNNERPTKPITDLIAIIQPNKETIVSKSERDYPLEKGDTINVMYYDVTQQNYYEVLRSFSLRDDTRFIEIGTIGYAYRQKNAQNMNNDITGLTFHNHIAIPINIYLDNMHIGYASKDDGYTRMGGSKNNVYLDNDNKGFRVGQTIKVELIKYGKYLTFQIDDNFATDIYIGLNKQYTGGNWPGYDDRFAYRLGEQGPFPDGESDLQKFPLYGYAFYKLKNNEIIPRINTMVVGDKTNNQGKGISYQTRLYKNPLEITNSYP